MDIALKMLELIGPTLVAILTVPLLGWVKKVVQIIDAFPPWAQQILAVLMAFGLTQLGTFLNVQLPTELSLFTESSASALLSAAMAFGIHAGKKAREVAP